MEKDGYTQGTFCWVDLQTSDTNAAKAFYGEMLGWDAQDMETDMGPVYTMFSVQGRSAAGMGAQPPEMAAAGVPPIWSSYIWVDDIDATVAKATELGATVMMPVMQVMEQGSMAFLTDPTGATFGLWQPNQHRGAGWVNSVGGFCWNELYTSDTEKASAFYGGLFGWEITASPMGESTYWSIRNNGNPNGGMMEIPAEWGEVPAHWGVYFTVEVCKDAVAKAESLGATMYLPPTQVPEVGTFAGLMDPQGGRFMVIELDPNANNG